MLLLKLVTRLFFKFSDPPAIALAGPKEMDVQQTPVRFVQGGNLTPKKIAILCLHPSALLFMSASTCLVSCSLQRRLHQPNKTLD